MIRILQILIAFDRLVNTLFMGSADETLSGRSYRLSMNELNIWGFLVVVIDCVFFWQPDHCKRVYEKESRLAKILAGH